MAKEQTNLSESVIDELYYSIKRTIEQGRNQAYYSANFAMVESYWNIGRLIVEDELSGKHRAEYGRELIKNLSFRLMKSSGKGFNERNLWYMKQFYLALPILHALRAELSWTHYRLLLKAEREDARLFYMQEAIDGSWSTRTLERQMNSLYFERMILTQDGGRKSVKAEAEGHKELMEARDMIKDPYVLDFLDLKPNTNFYEQGMNKRLLISCRSFY
ncbi:DUF1016 N-terminal domain-containing protein [Pedobacter gandavensis]|uniref:DUF1016 N-terminal domain-containing protein n=1 Tax=Pedobacter gandavensis TaxID=2679963 RepID=UPI001F486E03|nr:DUF1016 N-terminal domain-containing protein [Pedobacter gandavensis]